MACHAVHAAAGDVPVIVVGGGAPLCGEALPGASRILVPPHAAVANAVGAAIPQARNAPGYPLTLTGQLPWLASNGSRLAAATPRCTKQAVQPACAGQIPHPNPSDQPPLHSCKA